MERLSLANKRIIITFFGFLITGMITCMIPVSVIKLHHLPAFSYIIMIILWGVTIRRRIVDAHVRRRVLIACIFMVFLFFLRMCKYSYFPEDVYIMEYIWYAYSIPLTAIPLFMFMAALRIEPAGNKRLLDITEWILGIINIALITVVMTNESHSMVYAITVHPDKEYTHEWFYYVITFWRVALAIATLYVFFRKCSLTAARKKWYIPALCISASLVLLTWYLINGGAPRIGGHKLFQLQEALCIPFIMAFESVIQIGMIPANSGYRRLFDRSGINACIFDNSDNVIVSSLNFNMVKADADHRIQREPVSGGYVTWVEDISAINSLNRELEEVTEDLRDENELIRQENEVRAERVSFETKNRLYNRIATAVRTRAVRVDELLESASQRDEGDDDFRRDIIYASVLSAYIKRMGNLMLLTDDAKVLSSAELGMALRESLDYIELNGCVCDISENGRGELASPIVLLAYELFETAVEDVWLRLHTLTVLLDCTAGFDMTIAMDASAEAITSTWKDKELTDAGCSLSVKYEDETYYIRLSVIRLDEKEMHNEEVKV